MTLDSITVILEKNPTTGYWKAFVLQDGHRGPNLCANRPTKAQTAKSTATRTLQRTGFQGRINFVDGAPGA
jgi:hypothetical protein